MGPEKKPSLLDWLCLRSSLEFSRARWLGAFAGLLVISSSLVAALVAIMSLLSLLAALLGLGIYADDPTAAAVRNLGLLVAAVFAAPFLVWRTMVAQVQANTAEQGLITERINKAVEGLGSVKTVKRQRTRMSGKLAYEKGEDGNPNFSKPIYEEVTAPNLEVRIGGLFALERISQDSPRDYLQILEIICAYIRENSPSHSLEPTPELEKRPDVRTDIQTAIKILARRSEEQISFEWKNQFRLDLRNCNLSGVDFEAGNFSATMFHRSRLEGAVFSDCKLEGTQFFSAVLNYADFDRAQLIGTRFDNAIFNLPAIPAGSMSHSITMANIHSIVVASADLSEITYLGESKDSNRTFGTKDTKLHRELEFDRRKYDDHWREIRKLRRNGELVQAKEKEQELEISEDFIYWVPFDTNDLAFGRFLGAFMDRHGLYSWPHRAKPPGTTSE